MQFGLEYGINNSSGKPNEEEVFAMLSYAAGQGIRILDTADSYGNALELIGRFQKEYLSPFLINTKFRIDEHSTISSQLQSSIEQLNAYSINTCFYHCFNDMADHPDSMNELKDLKAQRLIGKIGVSVYDNLEFQLAIENNDVDVIQLPFNLLDNYSQRGQLLRLAKKRRKEIHVRSIFLQGLFFKKPQSYPHALRPLTPHIQEIRNLVETSGKSMEEVSLGYAIAKKEIDYVIIGVDNLEQLKRNLFHATNQMEGDLIERIDEIEVKEIELLYPKNWK